MPNLKQRPKQIFLGSILVLSAGLAGCKGKPEPVAAETKRFRPAEESSAAAAEPSRPPVDTASTPATDAAVTPRAIEYASQPPTGSTAQRAAAPAAKDAPPGVSAELQPILQQLDRLALEAPRGNTQQEQLENLVRTQSQRLSLAKKALSMNPPAEVKQRIVMAMYEIHQVLVQLRVPNAMNQLVDFAKSMSADADAEIARIGRHAVFTANLSRIASQPLDSGKEIAAEAKKLLESESGALSEATQELVGQTADMLTQSGFKDDAAGLIEALAAAMSKGGQKADQGERYALIARLIRADFDTLLDSVLRNEEGADAKLVGAVKTLLAEVPPGRDLLNRTQTVAHILESTGHYESAQACFDAIAAAFQNVAAPELADSKDIAEKAKQRMALIGQPLAVEGVLVDGRPFDWSAYAGKVVLVDFWATWCGPCIEELPNIKQNFEQFHAKGFEVVGVNLNTNANDLKQFLSLQDLPWATVTTPEVLHGKVEDRDWTKLPMAARCGVESIPFVVLIGKDGKVDSIHVRGSKLRNRLTQLLGEPITSEVPADPTQPARPATSANPPANVR